MKPITQQIMLDAIKGTQGIITKVQSHLQAAIGEKISWHTVEKYINKWEATKEALRDEKNVICDVCDQKIYEAIMQGDMQTIKWYATLQMKDRGYDPGATLRLAAGDPLNINFNGLSQADLEAADNVELGGPDE